MKITPAASLIVALFSLTYPAQAGWFDSLLGNDDEASEQAEAAAPVTSEAAKTLAVAQPTDLVSSVSSQLGLNKSQAQGGLGSLLSLAQSNLGESDFSQLASSIPGADSLLAAVPALDANSGVSGLLSEAGDLGQSFQGAAMVYDAFEKLGIKKEYVGPMIDITKAYLDSNGTEGTVDLLMKGVGALL